MNPTDVRWILENCHTWAIIGLADNPSRPAHGVARFLQQHGKRIIPVHPGAETVWGEQGYASLAGIPFPVDCVDVFRRSETAGAFADQAITLGAKAVWFQLGVIDTAAGQRATAAGLRFAQDRCPVIEWPQHGPA